MRGILLGRPVDLLLDLDTWHVLGFVVLCGDEVRRFLPFGAAQPRGDEIAAASALMLLDDVGFYEERGVSFRSLLEGEVGGGFLSDLELDAAGSVRTLVVERDGAIARLPAEGALVVPTRAAA